MQCAEMQKRLVTPTKKNTRNTVIFNKGFHNIRISINSNKNLCANNLLTYLSSDKDRRVFSDLSRICNHKGIRLENYLTCIVCKFYG